MMTKKADDQILFSPHTRHIFDINSPKTFREWQHRLGIWLPGEAGLNCRRRLRASYFRRVRQDFTRVLENLPKGSLCIDLGANIGSVAAKMLDHDLRVIAFEPDPITFKTLEKNMVGRDGIRLINAAAWTHTGRSVLQRGMHWEEESLKGSQAASLAETTKHSDAENQIEVETIDFASFVKELGEPVALVKVDIEGAEWDLLSHLMSTDCISLFDHMFVETHEWLDHSKKDIAARMRHDFAQLSRPNVRMNWV